MKKEVIKSTERGAPVILPRNGHRSGSKNQSRTRAGQIVTSYIVCCSSLSLTHKTIFSVMGRVQTTLMIPLLCTLLARDRSILQKQ